MDVNYKQKAAIFASGNGSNAINILRNIDKIPNAPEIECLICDQSEAPVLEKLTDFAISTHVTEDEEEVLEVLTRYSIDWVFLAGYMRILSHEFLSNFYDANLNVNRIINIHPSLLPDFKGRDGYGDAYRAGVKKHGATVHFVDDGIDTGQIILQRSYDVTDGISLENFKAQGLKLEHGLYLEALKQLFEEGIEKCMQHG